MTKLLDVDVDVDDDDDDIDIDTAEAETGRAEGGRLRSWLRGRFKLLPREIHVLGEQKGGRRAHSS